MIPDSSLSFPCSKWPLCHRAERHIWSSDLKQRKALILLDPQSFYSIFMANILYYLYPQERHGNLKGLGSLCHLLSLFRGALNMMYYDDLSKSEQKYWLWGTDLASRSNVGVMKQIALVLTLFIMYRQKFTILASSARHSLGPFHLDLTPVTDSMVNNSTCMKLFTIRNNIIHRSTGMTPVY